MRVRVYVCARVHDIYVYVMHGNLWRTETNARCLSLLLSSLVFICLLVCKTESLCVVLVVPELTL